MREIEINEKLRLIEKEILCTGDEMTKVKLDLKAEIDELKIDIEAVKRLVKQTLPGGEEEYRKVKESVIREINPEMGSRSAD